MLLKILCLSSLLLSPIEGFQNPSRIRSSRKLIPIESSPVNLVSASYDLMGGSCILGTLFGLGEDILKKNEGPVTKVAAKISGALAVVLTLFGLFVGYQTTTLRFSFSDTNFSLGKSDGSNAGENVVVGGENSWKYDTFVNWNFLPSENFPILVYFRENQTPRSNWVEGPDALTVDKEEGQVHYFPAIANVKQLKMQFEAHGCKHL